MRSIQLVYYRRFTRICSTIWSRARVAGHQATYLIITSAHRKNLKWRGNCCIFSIKDYWSDGENERIRRDRKALSLAKLNPSIPWYSRQPLTGNQHADVSPLEGSLSWVFQLVANLLGLPRTIGKPRPPYVHSATLVFGGGKAKTSTATNDDFANRRGKARCFEKYWANHEQTNRDPLEHASRLLATGSQSSE